MTNNMQTLDDYLEQYNQVINYPYSDPNDKYPIPIPLKPKRKKNMNSQLIDRFGHEAELIANGNDTYVIQTYLPEKSNQTGYRMLKRFENKILVACYKETLGVTEKDSKLNLEVLSTSWTRYMGFQTITDIKDHKNPENSTHNVLLTIDEDKTKNLLRGEEYKAHEIKKEFDEHREFVMKGLIDFAEKFYNN